VKAAATGQTPTSHQPPPARQGAKLPISSGGIKVSVAVIAEA